MKTFLLNSTPQTEAFLTEKRKDPVTGETFKEGDEIVFCASCKSAFLKGSWEYMGGEHCKQSDTLEVFPDVNQSQKALNLKEKGGEYLFKIKDPVRTGRYNNALAFSFLLSAIPLVILFLVLTKNLLDMSVEYAIAISYIGLLIPVCLSRFKKVLLRHTEFRQRGVFLKSRYISYQEIAECRLSYVNTHKDRDDDDGVIMAESIVAWLLHDTDHMQLEIFLHNQEEVHIVRVGNSQIVKYFEQIIKLSDKFRLVVSPNTFTESDHEFLSSLANQENHTYYTESLYYGYF